MSGALFGHSGTPGRTPSKHLVEFRAGKMYLKGTTVTPDKRKGLVYIYQADDSLIHFCWKDRTSGVVEDDLIIFPDDCEFKRIQQCTTGRVYLLKFKSNARKFFFWLQEPKTDKDEENCKKVNETLNNPPAPGSNLGGGRGGLPADLASLGAGLGDGGLQSMLGNVDQQQLMQLLGSGGLSGLGGLGLAGLPGLAPQASSPQSATPAVTTSAGTRTSTSTSNTTTPTPAPTTAQTPAPTAAQAAAASSSIQLSDLQSILRNMNIPADQAPQARVDFAQVLTSDVMAPLLENPEFQQQLLQYAPEGENLPRDPQRLRETLQSPQFQQAMNMFTAAFQSGQLGPLIGQFELGAEATEAANKGDLEAFGKALQAKEGNKDDSQGEGKSDKEEDKSGKGDGKPGDEDDSMQVD
ncbi:Proteasomal ubiquitin receptor ADRM1 [Holothuria leucospilota]|uniref:Proteasomal ubiquitin receptor ADRM1 n=1 Tax=Holothuria leucospilota TaxID=206669 RepID=A0A9Q0YLN0_HOLLE|nr:Proteasomal ubiquitin receptor ADRM1 [Holothuria leucospilota]